MHTSKNTKRTRFLPLLVGSWLLLLSGVLYAAGIFPSLWTPLGQTPNGTYSTRLTNMSQSCPSKSFIKGFDADYKPICVPYNSPNSASSNASLTSFSAPLANGLPGGKFGTFFNNLLNTCSTNGIVKGFNEQGKKICVNSLDRSTPTDSPGLASFTAMTVPSTPSWETTGGAFQLYFNKMFTSCSAANQWVTGIGSDGTPTCATIPLDGTCGWSNGGSFYASSEITSACSSGTPSGISGSGPWSWSCGGLDGGSSASCSANKKVDGGWTGFGACSTSCGPGIQTRTCTNPSPQNGGSNCVGSSTQSCSAGACCVPDGSCSATLTCETTTYGTDNCGNSCSKTGGSCACVPNGSCNATAPACNTITYGTDNCGNSCSKNGGPCGGGGGGGSIITCPAWWANGVLSPDQSPGIANSCSFTWQSGTYINGVGSSQSINGTNGGTANGTCNKYGNWDYFFNCPNKAPGAVNCVGGGYSISSPDGSNTCQFYWPNLLAGQSTSVTSTSGSPGGSANGSCNSLGQWTYLYSCPNKWTPSCSGGWLQSGVCSFHWWPATAGSSAFAPWSPYGTISASCNANGDWVNINISCP